MTSSEADSQEWQLFATKLGHNLQRLRLARGLSQEQVAYRARLSRYTYQKYESGHSRPGTAANPTIRSVIALSQVLGVALEELLPELPDVTSR